MSRQVFQVEKPLVALVLCLIVHKLNKHLLAKYLHSNGTLYGCVAMAMTVNLMQIGLEFAEFKRLVKLPRLRG
jgi:hypothetical protein